MSFNLCSFLRNNQTCTADGNDAAYCLSDTEWSPGADLQYLPRPQSSSFISHCSINRGVSSGGANPGAITCSTFPAYVGARAWPPNLRELQHRRHTIEVVLM
jgi:hypothetical protein